MTTPQGAPPRWTLSLREDFEYESLAPSKLLAFLTEYLVPFIEERPYQSGTIKYAGRPSRTGHFGDVTTWMDALTEEAQEYSYGIYGDGQHVSLQGVYVLEVRTGELRQQLTVRIPSKSTASVPGGAAAAQSKDASEHKPEPVAPQATE